MQLSKEEQEQSLAFRREDFLAMLVKGLSGAVPFVGNMLAEVFGAVIPRQRLDRLVEFVRAFEQRVMQLELSQRALEERFVRPEFVDLFEDGASQAARALSQERREYIANLLAKGLSEEELNHARAKKLLRLLESLTDQEIVYLKYFSLADRGEDDEFYEQHEALLEPRDTSWGASTEEIDLATLQEAYEQTLARFGLVQPGDRSATWLGRLLLRYIDSDSAKDTGEEETE
jgi:hypothetical protein